MSFFTLSSGTEATGTAEASHVGNMGVIPDSTQAPAQVKDIVLMDPTSTYHYQFYEVLYKLAAGDYKGREVRMKIKCFDTKSSVADRGKNLLKRLFDLSNYVHTHDNAPTTQDLYPLIGKIMGIKISEYLTVKSDGSPANGNYVSAIFKADKDFETLTGVKLDVPVSSVETAFSRNPAGTLPPDDSGIPF